MSLFRTNSLTQEQTLITLPKDVLFSILNELDDDTFADLCATSRFLQNICQDQYYWKLRYINRFGKSKRNYIEEYRLKSNQVALNKISEYNIDRDLARETFQEEYVWGDSEKARDYFKKYGHLIDVDYDEGYFLIRAADYGDERMLRMLLAKKPKADLSVAINAAQRARCDGCVRMLTSYINRRS